MKPLLLAIATLSVLVCSNNEARAEGPKQPTMTTDTSLAIPKLSFDAKGKPIIMMFRWDARDKERPVWSQAFSPDNGKTWEWNWYNVSERIK